MAFDALSVFGASSVTAPARGYSCRPQDLLTVDTYLPLSRIDAYFSQELTSQHKHEDLMEVLAAGASVAGLLSLTGQCVSGARDLKDLYDDIANASKTAAAFLNEVNSLLNTLYSVRDLLQKVQAQSALAPDDVQLTTLKLQLDDCHGDVQTWLSTARRQRVSSTPGAKAWFKRFWVAANKGQTQNVRSQMQQRRSEINIALSALGRAIDLQTAAKTANVEAGVLVTQGISKAVLEQSVVAQETLERIERLSESIASFSVASRTSRASRGSSMSPALSASGIFTFQSEISYPSVAPEPLSGTDTGLLLPHSNAPSQALAERRRQKNREAGHAARQRRREYEQKLESQLTNCREDIDFYRNERNSLVDILAHIPGYGQHFPRPPSPHSYRDTKAFKDPQPVFLRTSPKPPGRREHSDSEMGSPGYVWSSKRRRVTRQMGEGLEASHDLAIAVEGLENNGGPTGSNDGGSIANIGSDYGIQSLQVSSWNASLLGDWTSKRDRINRWMLHALGSQQFQVSIHQKIYNEVTSAPPPDRKWPEERVWSRLVLKYWFLDEAAVSPREAEVIASRLDVAVSEGGGYVAASVVSSLKSLDNQPPSEREEDVAL